MAEVMESPIMLAVVYRGGAMHSWATLCAAHSSK
jgi:hypothetical protein